MVPVLPTVHLIPANGIDYRVLEWLPDSPAKATALLLHGYMDAGSTWDLVVPRLAAAGLRVLAPDLRGYGETGRVGAGGYYHFPDYIFDVADVIRAMAPATPLFLVGHSMGGTVATLYAGTFPEHVTKLALLEGVGPPDNPFELAPVRMRRWIDDVRAVRSRGEERAMASHDEALKRLKANHASVDDDVLRERLPHLVRHAPPLAWKHDPLHKTASPMPFFAKTYMAFAKNVVCPTLFVEGGPLGYHPPDEGERLAAFAQLERATLDGAGHMMHWTRPLELADILVDFWKRK